MRAVALLLLCPTLAFAGDPCPKKDGHNGWPEGKTIYIQNDAPELAEPLAEAMAAWNQANEENGSNVKFELLTPSSDPAWFAIHVKYGNVSEFAGGKTTFQVSLQGNLMWPPPALMMINWNWIKPDLPGFNTAARRAILHELGHTMGLDHPDTFEKGGSVMNGISGLNDLSLVPDKPSPCDRNSIKKFRAKPVAGIPSRTRPEGMPPGPMCQKCVIVTPKDIDLGRPGTPAWCCGNNTSLNARPWWLGPDMAFVATGYRCGHSGWNEVACKADMCCVHPDDMPPEGEITYGTTCYELGWWSAEGRDVCEYIAGTPDGATEEQKVCVKKEVCGPGACEPWPHYCWKLPNWWRGRGQGGGGGGGGDDTPPPPGGKTCSSMGWYDGTTEGYALCTAAHEDCVTKSNCDGQCYPDPPGYCFQGND